MNSRRYIWSISFQRVTFVSWYFYLFKTLGKIHVDFVRQGVLKWAYFAYFVWKISWLVVLRFSYFIEIPVFLLAVLLSIYCAGIFYFNFCLMFSLYNFHPLSKEGNVNVIMRFYSWVLVFSLVFQYIYERSYDFVGTTLDQC